MPPNLENSRVRLATAAAIVVAVVGGVWRGATLLEGIRRDLQQLTANAYTMDRASEVALRMAIENPGTRIPNPRDPTQVIVVTGGRVSATTP